MFTVRQPTVASENYWAKEVAESKISLVSPMWKSSSRLTMFSVNDHLLPERLPVDRF